MTSEQAYATVSAGTGLKEHHGTEDLPTMSWEQPLTLGESCQAEISYVSWPSQQPRSLWGPSTQKVRGEHDPSWLCHRSHKRAFLSVGLLDMTEINPKNNSTVYIWAGIHHC